jgi:hypothetical protein
MKKKLFLIVVILVLLAGCVLAYIGLNQTDTGSIPVSKVSGSEISQTPPNVTLRFEAVVVNRQRKKCIELFTPEEFEKHGGDSKWAISSTLGFEPGLFTQLRESGNAMVTGRYVFVRDVHDGPCGIVTGKLFEISEIEYF